MSHAPIKMVYSHRSNQKHAHNTRHGTVYRNHWFDVYRCPACGRTASRKRQPIICFGQGSEIVPGRGSVAKKAKEPQ